MDSPTTIILFDPSCLDEEERNHQKKNKEMDLDYEYSDDEASLELNRNTRRTTNMNVNTIVPLSPTRMLLIDELDSASKNKSTTTTLKKSSSMSLSPQHRSRSNTTSHSNNINRIKRQQQPPMNVPCPCCKAYVHCQRQPQKDKNLLAYNPDRDSSNANASTNSLTSLVQSIFSYSSTENDDQHSNLNANAHNATALEEAQRYSPKQLRHTEINTSTTLRVPEQPVEYTILKCLKETWLYKKGSGKDVFGSTHWKPRWCQLVLANVNVKHSAGGGGTRNTIPIPVPLLLVSWHFSLKPSTVIVLRDKITIAVNANDNLSTTIAGNTCGSPSGTANANANANCHSTREQDAHAASLPFRFDIVQCQNQHTGPFNGSPNGTEDSYSNSNHTVTRTFALKDLDERDGWVYELNEAICRFEKEKKIILRQQMRDSSSVISNGNGNGSRDGTGMGMNSYSLPPIVPRVRLEREVSGASNLEGLDLVL